MKTLPLSALAVLLTLPGAAAAQLAYTEVTDGDLGVPSSPTVFGPVDSGVSTVTGSLQNASGFDTDAFSFTVRPGQQLDSLQFTSLTGSNHFFAFNDGPLSTTVASDNLISTLLGSSDTNLDLLDGQLNVFGGSGLIGDPLGPGDYFVWLQETDGLSVDYTIQFSVSGEPIPEPASIALALTTLAGTLARRRR